MKKTIRLIGICVLMLLVLCAVTACHQKSITGRDNEGSSMSNENSFQTNNLEINQNQHEHRYVERNTSSTYLKTSATCTHPAIYYYSCECGAKGSDSFESGNPIAHSYTEQNTDSTYLKTSATCTHPAVYYYSCECGAKGSDSFESGSKNEHKIVIDEAISATCLSSGLSEGSHCEICFTTIQAQTVIPAKGHTIVIDEAENATCVTSGLSEGSHCSSCYATIMAQDIIPATGHDYSPATYTKPATCTKCGATTGGVLQKQPINITKPYLPTTQYGRYRITSCSYNTAWNGDGTYDVTVTFYFTNISSSTITGGVWATLSGIEPGDGTAKTLSPGSSGSCVVKFFNVDAGDYTIIIE